jgi:hypothetical protein
MVLELLYPKERLEFLKLIKQTIHLSLLDKIQLIILQKIKKSPLPREMPLI